MGTNLLVGLNGRRLVEETRKILRGEGKKGQVPKLWDGHASSRIVQTLVDQLTSSGGSETVERVTSRP